MVCLDVRVRKNLVDVKLKDCVIIMLGICRAVLPQLWIVLPQKCCVHRRRLLIVIRLCRSRVKPLSVPRLGQVLPSVKRCASVRLSRFLILLSWVGSACPSVRLCSLAMILSMVRLRLVQFRMAVISRGIRLR